MTLILGGDYSTARPRPEALAAAGWHFVCRYLRDIDKTNGDKSLSLAEAIDLQRAGLSIVSNDETTGKQGLSGITGGRADAGAANIAHLACGGPADRPIYFSPWDKDPAILSASQWNTLEQYLIGVGQAISRARVGLYAGLDMITWAFDNRLITYGWEAAGWHHKRPPDPRSHIIQQIGSPIPGTDIDHAVKEDYGQWNLGESQLNLDSDSQAFITRTIQTNLRHAMMLMMSGRTGSVFSTDDLSAFHYDEWKTNNELELGIGELRAMFANMPQMVVAALPQDSGTFTLLQVQGACEQAVRNVLADAATPDTISPT